MRRLFAVLVLSSLGLAVPGGALAQDAPPQAPAAEPSRGDAMRAYHAALARRRLGQEEIRLGDALAAGGVFEQARAYLRRVLKARDAWAGVATYARRSVRRLVDVALESQNFEGGAYDVKDVPESAPPEARAEVSYMNGRARE